jgi:hypothetical protein
MDGETGLPGRVAGMIPERPAASPCNQGLQAFH